MKQERLQAKLNRARQAQMCDKDGKPFFHPNTGRAPSQGENGVPRWESLYSQRNQAEEKRQQLKKQLEEEQRQARSTAIRVNPKSEKLLAGTSLPHPNFRVDAVASPPRVSFLCRTGVTVPG